MPDLDQLAAHAERIRASGVLGRSANIRRLFDFLVERAATGRAPKEAEIAIDAFGRSVDFDVGQDAVVRVYVHKLRRLLEAFYSGAGSEEAQRIVLPKGEYRLSLESRDTAAQQPIPRRRTWFIAAAFTVSILLNAFFIAVRPQNGVSDGVQKARANPIWSKLLDDDLPILIVVGDYYIVGESNDTATGVKRLVRDFSINSRVDLTQYLREQPEAAQRYVDLDLSYLPTALAPALSELMPVLSAPGKRIRVAMVSRLTSDEFRQSHIVYIGYLSGLGMLSDIVLSGSKYSIGGSYDEIIDRESGHHYFSEAGYYSDRGDTKYKDYGYFSTFAGAAGTQIVVIAGTRDTALINTSEELTDPAALETLTRQASGAPAFEALYEVYGMKRANVSSKLLGVTPLKTSGIWGD